MAHKIRVKFVPGTNKDGSPSKTNGSWIATDRTRGKTIVVAEVSGKNTKALRDEFDQEVQIYKDGLYYRHVTQHPNDKRFVEKHTK